MSNCKTEQKSCPFYYSREVPFKILSRRKPKKANLIAGGEEEETYMWVVVVVVVGGTLKMKSRVCFSSMVAVSE